MNNPDPSPLNAAAVTIPTNAALPLVVIVAPIAVEPSVPFAPTTNPPFAVTIPANAAAPLVCIVAPVLTVMSFVNSVPVALTLTASVPSKPSSNRLF